MRPWLTRQRIGRWGLSRRTIDPLNLASAAKDVKPIMAIPPPIRVEIAPEKNCSPCQMTEWLCLASSPKKSSSLASLSVADKVSPAPERVTEGHKEKGARPSQSGRGWGAGGAGSRFSALRMDLLCTYFARRMVPRLLRPSMQSDKDAQRR